MNKPEGELEVVYANEPAPDMYGKSVFLVGPTPRDPDTPSWRPNMIAALSRNGYNGVIFSPEPRDGKWQHDYDTQVEWEKTHLTMADIIIAWVPRELKKMPAFTTNVEFGTWINSGKIVYGRPENAEKVRYLDWLYKDRGYGEPYTSMDELAKDVISRLPDRDPKTEGWRHDACRFIPLKVWKRKAFQLWLQCHWGEGNNVMEAEVLWDGGDVTALRLKMWICEPYHPVPPKEFGVLVHDLRVEEFPLLTFRKREVIFDPSEA